MNVHNIKVGKLTIKYFYTLKMILTLNFYKIHLKIFLYKNLRKFQIGFLLN